MTLEKMVARRKALNLLRVHGLFEKKKKTTKKQKRLLASFALVYLISFLRRSQRNVRCREKVKTRKAEGQRRFITKESQTLDKNVFKRLK